MPTARQTRLRIPGPEADAKDVKAFGRYRAMAFITGFMLIFLTLEMVLKYVFQVNGVDAAGHANDVFGSWVAILHGWIYVIYVVTVFDLWSRMRWSFGRILALIGGGVVPVLSFVMEHRAGSWLRADLQRRQEHRAASANAPG